MTIATVFRILSTHAENEEYLDEETPEWIQVNRDLNRVDTTGLAQPKLRTITEDGPI
jgi:hypothetical protein